MSSRRFPVAVLVSVLIATVAAVSPVAATVGTPTTTTVSWPANPLPQNDTVTMEANVSPLPLDGGIVTLYRLVSGGDPVKVYENSVSSTTGTGFLAIEGGTLAEGDYDMYVAFTGGGAFDPSESATHTVQIRRLPNSVTLETSKATVYPGQPVTLTATASRYTAAIALWDAIDGAPPVLVDTQPPSYGYTSLFLINGLELGVHEFTAIAAENDAYTSATSAPRTVTATKRPTTTSILAEGVPEAGQPFLITVAITASDPIESAVGATGSITLKDGAVTIGTLPVTVDSAQFNVASFAAGQHTLSATYTGDTTYAGSAAETPLAIVSNSVKVSGVGLQYATFYPYRDSYRDSVAIRGTRQEPASVSIRIYSPANKLLRTVSIARGMGAYSYAWNGRNSSGTMYAAGKYKVVQILTDALNAKRTFTGYTNISAKRLYTYSATYTKNYTQVSRKTTTWLAWTFTLPSATVYKSLTFSIYGKDGVGSGGFGPHDYTYCSSSYVNPVCATRWKTFPVSASWKAVTGSASRDRSGRYVRLYAWGGYGATTITYGRVKVTYAILK